MSVPPGEFSSATTGVATPGVATPGDATLMLQRPVWGDPRIHLLDDLWLVTVFVLLLAVGLPWLFGGVEFDVGDVTVGLFALGAIHLVLAAVAAAEEPPTPLRRRLLTALHLAGVVIVGFVWRHAGGLQNPAYLCAFALPVVGAIFLSRWHSYLTALVSVLVVGLVALLQVPELRWYVGGLSLGGDWLARWFGPDFASATEPFSGFYAPVRYYVMMIEVFAILLFACALAAEYLGTIFERLHANVRAAQTEAQRGAELWSNLIEQLPLPVLLVDSDTAVIIGASERSNLAFGAGARLEGRPLFECVQFSYPDAVREHLAGNDGTIPQTVVRIAEHPLIVRVRVQHLAQRGRRLALMTIEDETASFGARAALDAAEFAALILDPHGRVLYFNRPASGLFSGLSVGDAASKLLAGNEGASPWWDAGLGGRRKMHITLGPRIYQVTSSAVLLPGDDARLVVAAFLPVARAAADVQQTVESTMVTPALVRTR